MRSRAYRRSCVDCGGLRDVVGRPRGDHRVLSAKGLCPVCSRRRMEEAAETDVTRSPDWWRAWREGTQAMLGGSSSSSDG